MSSMSGIIPPSMVTIVLKWGVELKISIDEDAWVTIASLIEVVTKETIVTKVIIEIYYY